MIQKPKRLLNVITSLYWELRGDTAPVLKHNNAPSYLSQILRLAKAREKKSVAHRGATPPFVPVTLGASQPLINWVEFDERVCPQQRGRSASPRTAAFNHLLVPVRVALRRLFGSPKITGSRRRGAAGSALTLMTWPSQRRCALLFDAASQHLFNICKSG